MKIALIDTETTLDQTVADFGCVIADIATGEILDQIGSLIYGQFDKVELWFLPQADTESFWSAQHVRARRKQYKRRIQNGMRSIASPALINVWMAKNIGKHDPVLMAYNLAFDLGKCLNTGIDLGLFSKRVCLMKLAKSVYPELPEFRSHCERHNAFTPTGRLSCTADNIARFVIGDSLDPEPHTALEDARDYELPIAMDLYARGVFNG